MMGLGLFRTGTNPPDILTMMEADGFNPLNPRAASAFRALGEIGNVQTVGVVSALQRCRGCQRSLYRRLPLSAG